MGAFDFWFWFIAFVIWGIPLILLTVDLFLSRDMR